MTNRGGGGGGGGYYGGGYYAGGNGGSGIVIIRYLTGSMSATGGTVTTSGSYTIHTFTSNGTFTVASPTPTPQGWYTSSYTYSTDAPHAVTSVNRGSFTDSFTYDENGNMTCRVESGVKYIQTYNADNRISGIVKLAAGTCSTPGNYASKWDFTYDGDGIRTGQSYTPYTDGQPGTAVITRYYFGGAYETTGGAWKKYYSFGGATLMRDADGFKYFLSDQLGSVSVVLSATGTILEQQRYLPFGQPRVMPPYASITSTDLTYTGQRDIAGTGLMDYKARFYSPYLNQFTQPDTIVPNLYDPQSLNRYSYVRNNPIRYTDPTGHKLVDDEFGEFAYKGKKGCTNSDWCHPDGTPKSKEEVHPPSKPWERDYNFTVGYTYGGPADNVNPNYYGGLGGSATKSNDTRVPYVSQFVPSQQNPNLCGGGQNSVAALGCFIYLAANLIPYNYGPTNTNHNFFLSYNVHYSETGGMTWSDIYYSNRDTRAATFPLISIGDIDRKPIEWDYFPPDSDYHRIKDSGGWQDGKNPVPISFTIYTFVTGPSSSGTMPYNFTGYIPSLQDVQTFGPK